MCPRSGIALALALAWLGSGCEGSVTPGALGIQGPEANVTARVTVTAPDSGIQAGDSIQLTATALDSAGAPLDVPTFDWATGDPSVATVSGTGLVTALAEGDVVISATAEGVTGSIRLSVAPAPPDSAVTIGLEEVTTGVAGESYGLGTDQRVIGRGPN